MEFCDVTMNLSLAFVWASYFPYGRGEMLSLFLLVCFSWIWLVSLWSILFGESYIWVSVDVPELRKSYFDSGLWWTSGSCLGICIPFYLYTSQRIWSVFNMVTRLGSGQFTGCVTFIWCHGHMALNMSFLSRVSVTGVIVYPYIRLLYSWIGNLIWVWTA